jgi:hypothetical protein
MLEVITDYSEIREAQRQFEQAFSNLWDKVVHGYVSYQGERQKAILSWSNELGLWASIGKVENNRYWNAFGLMEPRENSSNYIVSEINIPLKGINRRIAGVFAKDNEGHIFICHRGRIGGGRYGIGKTLFENNFRGDRWITIKDRKKESKVALIDFIKSHRLVYQVRDFVAEVDRIKKLATGKSEDFVPENDLDFTPEFLGEKHFELYKHVVSKCDHGFVVNELAKYLELQGLKVGNDRNRDLFVIDTSGNISTIYEVKTDISLYDLYSGVGQLLLNSCNLTGKPKLILVLPEELPKSLRLKLQRIEINNLIYELNRENAIFQDTEE